MKGLNHPTSVFLQWAPRSLTIISTSENAVSPALDITSVHMCECIIILSISHICWAILEILPVHARCMRACTLRKISRFFFSTSIVCPDIGMTRSIEKNEFKCQGAVLEPVHAMGLVCMHASKKFFSLTFK